MELLYLYIEDDGRNIKKQEFNFSPRYNFHYCADKNLISFECIDNKSLDFWGSSNITNITAIIGKNGTGKSNLIKYLLKHTGIEKGLIIAFEYDNKIDILTTINKLKGGKEIKISKISSSKIICHPAIYINPSIYQNTSIDSFKEKSSFDASEKNMIINDASRFIREDSIYAANIWLYHKYANTLRQLDFLLEYGNKTIPDIILPQKCFIKSLIYPYSKSPNNKEVEDFYKKVMDFYVNSFNTERRAGRTDVHNAFIYASLVFELYSYCYDMEIPFDWGDERALHYRTRAYIIFTLFDKNQDPKIGKLLIEIDILISEIEFYYDEKMQGYYISFEDAKKLFSSYFNLITLYKNNISGKESNKTDWIQKKAVFDQKLDIQWDYEMSSGEQVFLNLFSNIYYAKKQIEMPLKTKLDNIFLLLDEPEISFHPEWQRQFIYILIAFVSEIFKDNNVQIIMTSHSPVIVSDFPKNNVIFLDRNEEGECVVIESIMQENTFGANIHTLYRNSFFLKGLPIGEFAKQKIKNLFSKLRDENNFDENIKYEIQLVGDPIIRKQLSDLFKEKLHNNIEKRIFELKQELSELEKRQSNDKN